MKKSFLILAALVLTAIGFTACSSEDEKSGTIELPAQPYKADAVRLDFQGNEIGYKLDGSEAQYKITELELTESGYYFVRLEKHLTFESKVTRAEDNDYVYLFGMYTKDADGNYKLEGFGVVSITNLGGGKATVKITLQNTDGSSVSVSVNVTPPANNVNEGSTPTENLCKAWKIKNTRVEISGVKAFYQEDGCDINSIFDYIKQHANLTDELSVNQKIESIIFSKNGTFSLVYANGKTDRAEWQWEKPATGNPAVGTLKYTWEFGDMGYSFVDGTASVTIQPVGTPSQLRLYGTAKNGKGETKKVTITVNMI